jgi:tetratricopeptide (TPR) repeat protein
LIFIYPRWDVDQAVWWQYLPPVLLLVGMGLLFAVRKHSRAPLATLLLFVGTLFPALGFVNVYPFRFSFVADHFQYLASIAPISFAAALLATRLKPQESLRPIVGSLLLLALATLSWQQCRIYTAAETLWKTTIQRNPKCWMAYNNLSVLSLAQGRTDESFQQAQTALSLKPFGYREAEINLGNALAKKGEVAAAISAYLRALAIEPADPLARNNLGNALMQGGRITEASIEFAIAIHLRPAFPEAHCNLGNALLLQEKTEQAASHFQTALAASPLYAAAHAGLGAALARQGKTDADIERFRRALALAPSLAQAQTGLGNALLEKGRASDAIQQFKSSLKTLPEDAKTHFDLGRAHLQNGEINEALACWRKTTELAPQNPSAANELAWVLATWPDAAIRNGPEALALARRAVELSSENDPSLLDTLAAAQAECGQFPEAIATLRHALGLTQSQAPSALIGELKTRLHLYETRTPFRSGPASAPDH